MQGTKSTQPNDQVVAGSEAYSEESGGIYGPSLFPRTYCL